MRTEPPICPECGRPMNPWLERSSAGTIEAEPGRFVCLNPACSAKGVMVQINGEGAGEHRGVGAD